MISDTVVTEIRSKLRSFTGQHERSTYLSSSVAADDVSLPVADGTVVDQGLVEIGDELIYIQSSASGAAAVPPYGRGYLDTTAAAHDSGTQVIVDPAFPRKNIRDAVENVVRSLYPQLYAVGTTELTYSAAVTSYELPADAGWVISASWQQPGASGFWTPLKRWRIDNDANADLSSTGKAIHISDVVGPGRPVQVVYAKPFTEFADGDATLASVGLLESAKDVLVYGACVELLQFLEASRQNMDSVQNQERGKYVPAGSASALARQLLGLYERRRDEERQKLRQLHPMSIRFTR